MNEEFEENNMYVETKEDSIKVRIICPKCRGEGENSSVTYTTSGITTRNLWKCPFCKGLKTVLAVAMENKEMAQ